MEIDNHEASASRCSLSQTISSAQYASHNTDTRITDDKPDHLEMLGIKWVPTPRTQEMIRCSCNCIRRYTSQWPWEWAAGFEPQQWNSGNTLALSRLLRDVGSRHLEVKQYFVSEVGRRRAEGHPDVNLMRYDIEKARRHFVTGISSSSSRYDAEASRMTYEPERCEGEAEGVEPPYFNDKNEASLSYNRTDNRIDTTGTGSLHCDNNRNTRPVSERVINSPSMNLHQNDDTNAPESQSFAVGTLTNVSIDRDQLLGSISDLVEQAMIEQYQCNCKNRAIMTKYDNDIRIAEFEHNKNIEDAQQTVNRLMAENKPVEDYLSLMECERQAITHLQIQVGTKYHMLEPNVVAFIDSLNARIDHWKEKHRQINVQLSLASEKFENLNRIDLTERLDVLRRKRKDAEQANTLQAMAKRKHLMEKITERVEELDK